MEPNRDTTIERLMQARAVFLNPGKTSQKATLTLMNRSRDLNRMLDRMNRGQSIAASELRAAIDQVHDALFDVEQQINRDVEVIV
jgi:hypothetical protein